MSTESQRRVRFVSRWRLALLLAWAVTGCDDSQAPPPPITATDLDSSTDAAVVIDDMGNALAVWTQYDGVGFRLRTNYFTPDDGWEGVRSLDSGDATAFGPLVAMAPGGEAMVVWAYDDECCQTWSRYFTPDAGWGEPEPFEDGRGDELALAMDATGEAILVGSGTDPSSSDHQVIWANRFASGVGWSGREPVHRVEGKSRVFIHLDLDVNAAGMAALAWSRIVYLDLNHDDGRWFLEGEAELGVNRFTPDSGWESAHPLDDRLDAPNVAMDDLGNAVVVWTRSDDGRRSVWAIRFEPGVGWDDAESVDHGESPSHDPGVAMNAEGTAMVVWRPEDSRNLAMSRFTPSTGWAPAGVLETKAARSVWRPRVAVDSSGNAIAVWLQRNADRRSEVWASRFTADDGWGDVERINAGEGDAYDARIAMNPTGNASVVWHQSDGTRFSIRSNRFKPDQGWGSAEVIDEAPESQE